jgi:integrase
MSDYNKVLDGRGAPIRGLWERNGRYIAQIRVDGRQTKVVLRDRAGEPVTTPAQAKIAWEELQKQKRDHCLPVLTRTPYLKDWVKHYLTFLTSTQAKDSKTIEKEKQTLEKWVQKLGFVRISSLRRAHINTFIEWRHLQAKVKQRTLSPRTINLDIIALNNCLNHAKGEGFIKVLPTDGWKPLQHVAPKRPLWTDADIEKVCQAALREGEHGNLLVDYLKFMAYSGARRNGALGVAWEHINWERKQVMITTKYQTTVVVDFNPRLEQHLKDMFSRRPGEDAKWLFPSPVNPQEPAKNLQGSLETARKAANLERLQFHDLRHYFISNCVMAGIDFMTIARWVGHKDGGILIGKVYGHLSNEHAKKAAEKVWAEPKPVQTQSPAPDLAKLMEQVAQQSALLQQLISVKTA